MASSFCPNCGTPRVGAFRFCRSCQFDFDELAAAPPPRPVAPAPVTAGPAISPTPGSSSRRSPGPLIAVVGFVLLGVVAGLAFTMAQDAAAPASTMSALTSPALTPTASPTASPTPDLRETAASAFRAFEDAYLDAYNALHDTLPTTGQFASYAQARSYYGTEIQNLRRFDAGLRGMTFPTDVDPDAQTLLERISKLATLMDKLVATKKEAAGWEINKKILKARDALHAARVVVGESLGLPYAPTPRPTARPTPKPSRKPTPRPTVNYNADAADAYVADAMDTWGEAMRENLNIVAQAEFFTGAGGESGFLYRQAQFQMAAGYIDGLVRDHLAFMKAHPAASCYRDAYATDRAIAKDYLAAAKELYDNGTSGAWPSLISDAEDARVEFYTGIARYFSDCR